MSTKEGIYFKSKSGKITLNTLMNAYEDLIPHNIQIIREVTVDNGFGHIISFAQEKSANILFTDRFKTKLNDLNLTAELTHSTTRDRTIYIPGVIDSIYNKEISEITEELVKQIRLPIRIMKVDKFPAKGDSSRKYLTITTDCRASREKIIELNSICLFGHSVKLEHPRPKGQNFRYPTQTSGDYARRPSANNYQVPPPPAPPRINVWHQRSNQQQQLNSNDWPSLHTQRNYAEPPQTRPLPKGQKREPDFNSDFDLNFFIKNTSEICKTLQSGMEHPEDYLNTLNDTYTRYGLPIINIPKEHLILSRSKFLSKYANPLCMQDTNPPISTNMPTANDTLITNTNTQLTPTNNLLDTPDLNNSTQPDTNEVNPLSTEVTNTHSMNTPDLTLDHSLSVNDINSLTKVSNTNTTNSPSTTITDLASKNSLNTSVTNSLSTPSKNDLDLSASPIITTTTINKATNKPVKTNNSTTPNKDMPLRILTRVTKNRNITDKNSNSTSTKANKNSNAQAPK